MCYFNYYSKGNGGLVEGADVAGILFSDPWSRVRARLGVEQMLPMQPGADSSSPQGSPFSPRSLQVLGTPAWLPPWCLLVPHQVPSCAPQGPCASGGEEGVLAAYRYRHIMPSPGRARKSRARTLDTVVSGRWPLGLAGYHLGSPGN